MVRRIAWADDYFAEHFVVEGADPRLSIDWVMHFSGKTVSFPQEKKVVCFSNKKPYKHLSDVVSREMEGDGSTFVTAYRDGEVTTHVFGICQGQTLLGGNGPDNPSVARIPVQIERMTGGSGEFAHVITSSDRDCKVKTVTFQPGDTGKELRIEVVKADGTVHNLVM